MTEERVAKLLFWISLAILLSLFTQTALEHSSSPVAAAATHHPIPNQPPARTAKSYALGFVPTPAPNPVKPDAHLPPVTDGMVPVITSLPTGRPVVFLGIDDGANKTLEELQILKENHIKASLFLARLFINNDPGFFGAFGAQDYPIEDHSLDHLITPNVITSYDIQKAQICGMADYDQQHFGRRPIFFRPPGGAYSNAMRRAAADCGMRAIVTWIAKANGGSMQYQVGDHLRPGDVVLMHFRPEFAQDMQAFLDAMKSQDLHTELLEDWQ